MNQSIHMYPTSSVFFCCKCKKQLAQELDMQTDYIELTVECINHECELFGDSMVVKPILMECSPTVRP